LPDFFFVALDFVFFAFLTAMVMSFVELPHLRNVCFPEGAPTYLRKGYAVARLVREEQELRGRREEVKNPLHVVACSVRHRRRASRGFPGSQHSGYAVSMTLRPRRAV
jgi:hypothetical protein